MFTLSRYDVIIIGSGAGGTLAYKLAPSGRRILLIERGGYVPREKDNWNPRANDILHSYTTAQATGVSRHRRIADPDGHVVELVPRL